MCVEVTQLILPDSQSVTLPSGESKSRCSRVTRQKAQGPKAEPYARFVPSEVALSYRRLRAEAILAVAHEPRTTRFLGPPARVVSAPAPGAGRNDGAIQPCATAGPSVS